MTPHTQLMIFFRYSSPLWTPTFSAFVTKIFVFPSLSKHLPPSFISPPNFVFLRPRHHPPSSSSLAEIQNNPPYIVHQTKQMHRSDTTKYHHVFLKLALCFLLLGLSIRLFFSYSFRFLSYTDDGVVLQTLQSPANQSPVPDDFPAKRNIPVNEATNYLNDTDDPGVAAQDPSLSPADRTPATDNIPVEQDSPADQPSQNDNVTNTKCDIFMGEWVRDPSGPLYTNSTCLSIEDHQNCMRNGRPDSDFLYWRWQPHECQLPRFDPNKFLDLMRNKSWGSIGDSISRNHVQSLLCTLTQVEQGIEVYHDKDYRSRRWHFPIHNFTISFIWAPFLIKAAIFEDTDGVAAGDLQLHLDKLNTEWTNQYHSLDYVVFAGGKWFLKTAIYYENDTIQGCHYCPGRNLTELGFEHAYRKTLELVFNFVTGSDHKPNVFFRTITPDHFENGEWFSGGYCNRTGPFREKGSELNSVDNIMHKVEVEEFEKVARMGAHKGLNMELLDTTHLSLMRPDGHPGVYRNFQPSAEGKSGKVQNDCLHWCLPGPIDSWNELLMRILPNSRER